MALNEIEYQGGGLWTQHVMDAHGDIRRIVIIGFGNPDSGPTTSESPQFRRYRARVDTHELDEEFRDRAEALNAAYYYVGHPDDGGIDAQAT